MADINNEMKAAADYIIKSASERFGQEVDYTHQSIEKIDDLLAQEYKYISHLSTNDQINRAITIRANLWGSYLGEFMRLNWGGTWIKKDSERLVLINNIEFSPIQFVNKIFTSNPDLCVDNYLIDAEKKILTIQSTSLQTHILPDKNYQSIKNSTSYKRHSIREHPRTKFSIDVMMKVGLFLLVGYYLLLLNSPVWPTSLIAIIIVSHTDISGSGLLFPSSFLAFPIDNGFILLLEALFFTVINLFVKGIPKKVVGIAFIILAIQYALPPIYLRLLGQKYVNELWTDGMKGLVIIGCVYLFAGISNIFGFFEKDR